MKKRLSDLSVGEKGRISGFVKGSREYRGKLLAMGLNKGTDFIVQRVAPLGDPVEISVRGFSMSLRRDEATVITVEG